MHFETGGYDLGIFQQAISRYSKLEQPVSELKGTHVNLLGDHFHPIVATVAPIYRLFPSPFTILLTQALLLAVSVGVVYSAASIVLRRPLAFILATAYGLSWGITGAVAYEFHEVAFAVPIIAVAVRALLRRQFAATAGWAMLLLLVKEDMGITVAMFGVLLFLGGARRLGALLATAGIAAFCLVVGLIVPLLSPTGTFAYWARVGVTSGGGDGGESPTNVFQALLDTMTIVKIQGIVLAFLPVAFLALFSRISILAIPTLAWHFLATNPNYSGTKYHYGVTLMPIVYLAAIDALSRGSRRESIRQRAPLLVATGVGLVAAATLAMAVDGPYSQMTRSSWWHRTASDQDALRAIATVPPGATVAAHNRLAAHLTTDRVVFLLRADLLDEFGHPVDVDYVIAETTKGKFPITATERPYLLDSLRRCGYEQIYAHHGYVTLRRGPSAPRGSALTACISPAA